MHIDMRKIGEKLDSRPAGREAFLAMQPNFREIQKNDRLILDFTDIALLTPSFADEFITPLVEEYGERLMLKGIQANASVRETLAFLAEGWPQKPVMQ